jgi:hypothetical protein
MLLGLPTSIAEAKVGNVGLGDHSFVAKKSGIVLLALVAKIIRSIGNPISLAIKQAKALPRFPVGIIKLDGSPVVF